MPSSYAMTGSWFQAAGGSGSPLFGTEAGGIAFLGMIVAVAAGSGDIRKKYGLFVPQSQLFRQLDHRRGVGGCFELVGGGQFLANLYQISS
jgi:hypothetical protein